MAIVSDQIDMSASTTTTPRAIQFMVPSIPRRLKLLLSMYFSLLQLKIYGERKDNWNRLSVERSSFEFPAFDRFEGRLIESEGETFEDARIGDVAVSVDDRFDDDHSTDASLARHVRVDRLDTCDGNGGRYVTADPHRLVAGAAQLSSDLAAESAAERSSDHSSYDSTDHSTHLAADDTAFLAAGRVGGDVDLRHFSRRPSRLVEGRMGLRRLLLHVRGGRVRRSGWGRRGRRGRCRDDERLDRLGDDLGVLLDVQPRGDDRADDDDVEERGDEHRFPSTFFPVLTRGFDQDIIKHGFYLVRIRLCSSGMMPTWAGRGPPPFKRRKGCLENLHGTTGIRAYNQPDVFRNRDRRSRRGNYTRGRPAAGGSSRRPAVLPRAERAGIQRTCPGRSP